MVVGGRGADARSARASAEVGGQGALPHLYFCWASLFISIWPSLRVRRFLLPLLADVERPRPPLAGSPSGSSSAYSLCRGLLSPPASDMPALLLMRLKFLRAWEGGGGLAAAHVAVGRGGSFGFPACLLPDPTHPAAPAGRRRRSRPPCSPAVAERRAVALLLYLCGQRQDTCTAQQRRRARTAQHARHGKWYDGVTHDGGVIRVTSV